MLDSDGVSGGNLNESELADLYRERFTAAELRLKKPIWEVLCSRVFQKYIEPTDTVLDLGAGTCEFINAIRCGEKIAVDINPDTAQHVTDARFVQAPSTDLSPVARASVDVVFASNLFEHLPDKTAVLATLRECHRILHPTGRLIILQPNLRYLPGRYWDYFDHHTPLTHHSMVEALGLAGFRPVRIVPRFLPYTLKHTRLPRSAVFLRLYLRLPMLWPLFGRQMLIVAHQT